MARKKKQPIKPEVVEEVKEALKHDYTGNGLITHAHPNPLGGIINAVDADDTTVFVQAEELGLGTEVNWQSEYETLEKELYNVKDEMCRMQEHYEYLLMQRDAKYLKLENKYDALGCEFYPLYSTLENQSNKGFFSRIFSNDSSILQVLKTLKNLRGKYNDL